MTARLSGSLRSTVVVSTVLAVAWAFVLAVFARRLVREYFPIGDEWALIANSDPTLTSPRSWFTSGFSSYFVFDPVLSTPYANFIRPSANLTYWLLGLVLSPTSRWRLCFTFVVIGLCAGLTYACSVRHIGPRERGVAFALSAAVPLLPAFAPSLIFLAPYNVFDALAAALCLLAYLEFEADRYWTTLVLITVAVFAKETAMPVAAALPVVCIARAPRRILRAAGFGLPVLLWLVSRRLAFGTLASGTYALGGGVVGVLAGVGAMTRAWPLEAAPLGSPWVQSVLPLVIDGTLMLGLVGLVAYRMRKTSTVDVAEVSAVFSYAFLLVVGISPRYGAVFEVFLVVSVARACQACLSGVLTTAFVVAVLGCAAIATYRTWQFYPATERLFVDYYRIARRYAKALDGYGAGDTVLVLNDPVTWHSRLPWLSAVLGNRAELIKAMDFACPTTAERLRLPCEVSLRREDGPRRFEFEESCGFEFCGTMIPATEPVRLSPAAGISIELQHDPAQAPVNSLIWQRMSIQLDRPGVRIFYFDPAVRNFRACPSADGDSTAPPLPCPIVR